MRILSLYLSALPICPLGVGRLRLWGGLSGLDGPGTAVGVSGVLVGVGDGVLVGVLVGVGNGVFVGVLVGVGGMRVAVGSAFSNVASPVGISIAGGGVSVAS